MNNKTIVLNGLWHNNGALVQLLGLCPLLAVSSTFTNSLALGIATIVTILSSNILISSLRHYIKPEIRIPIFILIIACTVTTVEILMHSLFFELYLLLGIFVPLIVTNCVIIGRAESFASKNGLFKSILDALAIGIGFMLILVLLGSIREIIGSGTLFAQLDLLFGNSFSSTGLQIMPDKTFLLAILPPGAFFGLAFIVFLKNLTSNEN
ncbi:MAG: electron transport complex subunit RsxE [Gammaproteobacteria bacterium]|nr:MAG: electron transport complex subunit RsxE [Gammaproteobacteria bacterium]